LDYFWSESGTYLYNVDDQGMVIRGGDGLEILGNYPHKWAQHAKISPKERYALSHSYNRAADTENYTIWNLSSGEDLRSFVTSGSSWCSFQWSFNDEYVARLLTDKISVYESATMTMLEDASGVKKSIDVPNVSQMSWSPAGNMLVVEVQQEQQTPGQVRLYEIPSRIQLASKAMKRQHGCRIIWQKSGDHLAVIVNANVKTIGAAAKGMEISIFYCRKNPIPVDNIPIPRLAMDFSWEDNGTHFTILYKDNANYFAHVYNIDRR
jgi:translation initiation factor 3 subunit B